MEQNPGEVHEWYGSCFGGGGGGGARAVGNWWPLLSCDIIIMSGKIENTVL